MYRIPSITPTFGRELDLDSVFRLCRTAASSSRYQESLQFISCKGAQLSIVPGPSLFINRDSAPNVKYSS